MGNEEIRKKIQVGMFRSISEKRGRRGTLMVCMQSLLPASCSSRGATDREKHPGSVKLVDSVTLRHVSHVFLVVEPSKIILLT